jgi:hypothetical protein
MTQERTRIPEDLFTDAELLLDAALRELDAGDIRQAAEKAWGATKRATDALILARTGEEPRTSGQTTRRIRQLALSDPAVSSIAVDFANRAWVLHGSCFYDGQCEPQESIAADIRATTDLIRTARQLASSG